MKPPPPNPCAVAKMLVISPLSTKGWTIASTRCDLLGGVVDGRPLRRADRDRDEAAILGRRQLGRGAADRRSPRPPAKRSAAVMTTIGASSARIEEARVEPLAARRRSRETARPIGLRLGAMLAAADPARGEHRHQRQRDEGREHHREGEHEAELGEEPAGGAGEERDRDEHRGERRRRRQDGEEHLPRAEHRGGARTEAERALARDVLDDDDGVVDDEAGREHEREQRQDVDREAGGLDRARACRSARSARSPPG